MLARVLDVGLGNVDADNTLAGSVLSNSRGKAAGTAADIEDRPVRRQLGPASKCLGKPLCPPPEKDLIGGTVGGPVLRSRLAHDRWP